MTIFQKILCITDMSVTSQNAEIASLKLANIFNSELLILCCGHNYSLEKNSADLEEINDDRSSEIKTYSEQKKIELKEHIQHLVKVNGLNYSNKIEYEIKLTDEVTASIEIVDEKNNSFDLIIVGKEQSGFWERLLFSSPAKEICDESRISTLIIPSSEKWREWVPKSILVASALNKSSELAEKYAVTIAKKIAATLTVLHVIDKANAHLDMNITHIIPIDYIPAQVQVDNLEDIKKEAMEKMDILKNELLEYDVYNKISFQLSYGRVGDEILTLIKSSEPELDLLVIGARGESALKRFFLGSRSTIIEEACNIPLLIVQKDAK